MMHMLHRSDVSLGKVPPALSPLQMEAGKEKTGPDWDPWAACENRLEGAEWTWGD